MYKLIVGSLLLLNTTIVNAFDFERYSGCVDVNGNSVLTVIGTTKNIAAAFIKPNFGPIILFDWKAARTFSSTHLDFVYLHECGHHVLGHIILTKEDFSQLSFVYEDEADCYAKHEFIRRYGRKLFESVLDEIEQVDGEVRRSIIEGCS